MPERLASRDAPGHRARRVPILVARLAALATAAVPLVPASAQLFQRDAAYSALGGSLWGTTTKQTGVYSVTRSLNGSDKIGGIAGHAHDEITPEKCVLGVCIPAVVVDSRTGSEYRAYSSGSMGFSASASASGGSIDVHYRAKTAVEVGNYAANYAPGDRVTLGASWTPTIGSGFSTRSPSLSADARLNLALTVGATGVVCGGGAGCDYNGGDFFRINTGNLTLGSATWTGTTQAKLLGANVPGTLIGVPVSPGDLNIGWTQAVDMTVYNASATTGATGIGTLRGTASTDMLRFAVDPVKLALDYTIPGGSCLDDCYKFGFGYDIAANRFGPRLGLQQDIEVTASGETVTYEFSTPVQWKRPPFWDMVPTTVPCAEVKVFAACSIAKQWTMKLPQLVRDAWSATAVSSVTVPVGQQIEILYPDTDGAGLSVATRFTAAARVHNTSRLRVNGSWDFDLLTVRSPGGTLGPVFDHSAQIGGPTLNPFFDKWIDLALGVAEGASFALAQRQPGGAVGGFLPGETDPPRPPDLFEPIADVTATPEPATAALLAAGLLACLLVGRRRAASPGARR